MLKYIVLTIYFLQTTIRCEDEDPSNPMKFKLPFELPDQNQDGYADNQDFQKAFKNLNLSRYEINQIFDMVDSKRQGKVSQRDWNDFYIAFITHFENSDSEPRDGLLEEEEVKKALEDITDFNKILTDSKRDKYLAEIMETLTSRTQQSRQEGKLSLNLNEYIFLRRAAIAWKECAAMNGYIDRASIQTCASSIMLPNSVRFSVNQQQIFFNVLENYSRADEKTGNSYRFLAFLSAFHKYSMFSFLGQNKAASGTLSLNELQTIVRDNEGNMKLNNQIISSVFGKLKNNLEFTGLDFKLFFILMQGIDYVYIYGASEAGTMTPDEWNNLLKDTVLRADVLDNIDDCYIDKEEAEEKELKTDHWARQSEYLQKAKMRRFSKIQSSMRKLPESADARKFAFQIHDINEDGKLKPDEMFFFLKYSLWFSSLTKNNIHLVYQRNFENDYNVQRGSFEFGLLKEELNEFRELEKFLKKKSQTSDLGINLLQFNAWFTHKKHFITISQQPVSADTIPFTSYKKVLEYLGYKLHRTDLEKHIYYNQKKNQVIPAQKFNLDAYAKDGAFVNFEAAFQDNLTRYSKTFMMKKFFSGEEKKA